MDSDTLFINQTELFEILNKFLTNIKKDGSERKTIDNYKRKANMLEAYWHDYQENHKKMCQLANFDHIYFKKGCFDTVQEVYLNSKAIIDNTLEQLGTLQLQEETLRKTKSEEAPLPGIRARQQQSSDHRRPEDETAQPEPGTSSCCEESSPRDNSLYTEGGSSKLNGLVKKQNINFKAFMRTASKIQVDKFENQWQFENALKSLDSRWGEIDKLHWEIEGEDVGDDIKYQMEFCKHEERYSELTNDINKKMWAVKHREKSAPKMDIPVFNGTYNQWVPFKDLFSEAIDKNPSMSNAQKMQFLKSKVTGEAERLIHHLQISSDNYQGCWEILNHRYGNKKLIFTSHINILLGLPNIQQQSLAMIKKLHDVTKETLHSIQNLRVDIATWDPLLVHLLAQKLDDGTFTEYIESVKNPRELPDLQEFLEFLETKFTALEASRRKQEPVNQKTTPHQPYKNGNYSQNQKKSYHRNSHQSGNKDISNANMSALHVSRSITCALCNSEHGLWRCPHFLQMAHEQKVNKIEQLNYCQNCLCSHNNKPCQSNKRCRKCLATHNTLLHDALAKRSPTSSAEETTNSIATKKTTSRSSHVSWDDMSEILLATAIIKVKGADGTQHKMRALVDQGSQLSLINENAAQILGLKRAHFKCQIFGVGEKENNIKGILHVTLQSANSEFTCDTNVIVMNNLIKRLPNNTFTKPTTWNHIQGIQLADPEFHISRPVDMLLGADVYSKIMLGGILRGDNDKQPIAQQTQLGWLLCGSMKPHYQCNVVLNSTEDLLKYWENEDINQKIEMSNDDHECLQFFIKTTKRLEDGRYEVRLPLKPEHKNKLGVTKPQALAQFRNLEKKFEKNSELRTDYKTFMDEYFALNHMIPCNINQAPECYLPHHAVIRAESTTTKLRVVFNASAKSSSGYSLNDVMYRGPNIQKDLQELILKWRQFQFVYTSDIEKMYRMIRVHQEDQAYQKVLWRESNNQPIQSFKLVTLTYGTKPAGFLAMICLKQLASDERQKFPDAAIDISTCRGLTVRKLNDQNLWWQGPSWLPSYTNQENHLTIYETNLEIKASILKDINAVVIGQPRESLSTEIIKYLKRKYSSITKIIRIFAWILRLPTLKKQVRRPYLELHELRLAKQLIIKNVQQTEFSNDLDSRKKHGRVHSKSKILSLNPTIDERGILRVGGRLENAHISPEMKHPIILPHDHLLTTLFIDQAHKLTFHGGARLTLANLRQQFWIIGGYMATKKFIRKCVLCRKQNPVRQHQLMGDLPEPRVNPEHAFYHCGIDYTGFVEVKANKGRGIKTTKGYIAVFVCMVTKAVHLELVSDLSSSAFLAALTRMATRKGAPRHMYSDNGTNFVGANRMIQEEYNQLHEVFSESFITEITEMGIEWHFNVPSWPNAGGLWERAVRSLKHHLKRIIGQQRLTFEEYTTLLARLEACLNSRPLCAISEDPDDVNFLTPAHFLSGRPGATVIETEQDARTRWHLTNKLFQDLWKRWKTEYLVQLSSRSKWMELQKNIVIGDLVVIHDDNLPPGKWALGRVVDTHPGNDGLTRAVSLKTKNGVMKRPIVKLSVLPVNQNNATISEPEPTTKFTERKRRARSKIATVVTVLLSFLMLIFPCYGLDDVKPLPSNQKLYFDPISKVQLIRDKWMLVMYYDMEPYWTGINTYNKIAHYQEQLCATIETLSYCNTIVQQARHDYQELEYYNELLLTQHFDVYARRRRATGKTGRRRRGLINGIGYLANDLFGVLDSRFADQYEKDIETIHRNEEHLSNLWKNQTSIIEAEFNLMKRMETTVNKQHKLINKKLMDLQENASTLQREIQNISYVNDFTLSAMSANSLLQGLRRLQDTLLDALTDIYHGQISIHLLPPTQLKRELQTIYGQMPSELTLPITNLDADLQYLYKLLKVKARATQKYVIIEVTFPLVSRESFKLYKTIPVPHQTNTIMTRIIPVSEYVAVNLKKDSFFSMSTHELTACLQHGPTYMCQLLKPIKDLQNDESFCDTNSAIKTCKVEKTNCTNEWLELHSTSQHFYFCCDTYTIKVICGDHVTVRQLSQAGVIAIGQGCVIKGKDFTLYLIRHQANHMNISPTIHIPEFDQINHLINIKIPDEKQTDDRNLTITMTSLGDAIEKLKKSDLEINDLSPHDIHQYVICYVLMSIALCVGVVWMWRTGRCRLCRKPTAVHCGEGTRRQQTAVTPPPPKPRRRSVSRCQQELAAAPLTPKPRRHEPYSEVLSARDLKDKSENGFGLNDYAKRWPSATYSAIKQDTNTDTGNHNIAYTVEDSIV